MAIVCSALGQSTADIEQTAQFASDRLVAYAGAVATATTAALGAQGAERYKLLFELGLQMDRAESTLVTLREFVAELRHRVAP